MDVNELFRGIAVIFDDEIDDTKTTIYKIKESLLKRNIPVAVYKEPPKSELIPSLSNASFVVIDWEYRSGKVGSEGDEQIVIPSTLQDYNYDSLIEFIKECLDSIFVPVFIFTNHPVETIKERLADDGLWDEEETNQACNRIFIETKDSVKTEELLFKRIEEWLESMPSAYALKEWKKTITDSENRMFLDLYECSPNWVNIIWKMIKNDSMDYKYEFGEFLTRNMSNRAMAYGFDGEILDKESGTPKDDELTKVLQGERYISYGEKLPDQAYTGDLYIHQGKYYLNVSAQCGIARGEDPEIYYVKGQKVKVEDIVTKEIELSKDGTLYFGSDSNKITLDEMKEKCKNEKTLKSINKKFKKYREKTLFRKGTLLVRNDKIIIGCIAGQIALEFDLNIKRNKLSKMNGKRIGRVFPPYITCIQQKCAQYIVRGGTMPMPEELFASSIDEIDE